MPDKKFHGKWLIVGFLVLLAGAIAWWQVYKYRLVHRGLDKVQEKSRGLYSIQYEDLHIDELAGHLSVRNVVIEPDTTVYDSLLKIGKAPSVLVNIHVPVLTIEGIKTPKAVLEHAISGRKLEMDKPVIEVLMGGWRKDSTVHDPARDIKKDILAKFKEIGIDSILLTDATVRVRSLGEGTSVTKGPQTRGMQANGPQEKGPPAKGPQTKGPQTKGAQLTGLAVAMNNEPLMTGEHVSVALLGLKIDSLTSTDSSRILWSQELRVECGQLSLRSHNKKYRYEGEGVRFSSRDNSVYVGAFRIRPLLSEEAFAASFPVQKDRYHFLLKGVRLSAIDRSALFHKRLEADSLSVAESEFRIYRDLSYPKDTVSKVGRYPQQMLTRLSVPLEVRTVVFHHAFIEYKERNAKSDSFGKLQFYDASATIHHVTNIRQSIARDNRCRLDFKARLLNKAPVRASMVLLLRDPKGRFTINGDIGAIDLSALNPLTEPMGLARMEKGRINGLHFDLAGTDSSSHGKLTMRYQDIKVSLLKKDGKGDGFDKKGLASLAAHLLMKKNNPSSPGEPAREVDVHFERIVNKSFFNLIWKSIFTGIKESVGMK